jgi:SM-20-related protein
LYEKIATDLAQRRWSLAPGFLADTHWLRLAERARRAWTEGELRPARVGQAASSALRPDVRSDWIGWLEPGVTRPELADYLARMEDLRLGLNRSAYLGLLDFETHLAVYPPGAAYSRHRDRFARDSRRALSTILYLNEDWKPDDGGALRLHLADGAREIEPRGGALVIFASDLEHEVLPARRERLSLAGWFRRRAQARDTA